MIIPSFSVFVTEIIPFILSPVSGDANPASPFYFCSPCKHNYFVLLWQKKGAEEPGMQIDAPNRDFPRRCEKQGGMAQSAEYHSSLTLFFPSESGNNIIYVITIDYTRLSLLIFKEILLVLHFRPAHTRVSLLIFFVPDCFFHELFHVF